MCVCMQVCNSDIGVCVCVHMCVCRLRVRSRMWDACIVVDGTHSFTFNDGAVVQLDMHDEYALRCVTLS